MADAIAGAVVTPTKTTDQAAPLIPERGEVLKGLASDVLKSFADLPELKAGDGQAQLPAEAGKTKDALSQSAQPPPAAPPATEPQWTAEQTNWFDQMAAAKTDAERDALQAQAPAFSPEEIAWLEAENLKAEVGGQRSEDHLAEDAELKGKLDAKTQERINQRIGKEVAKTKAAQEEAEQLKAKVGELESKLAAQPGPNAQTGPAAIETPQQLQAAATNAQAALNQAEDLLAQVEGDPAGVEAELRQAGIRLKAPDGSEDYSAATMRKWLTNVRRQAQRSLTQDLPARAEFLKKVDVSATEAMKMLPELKDLKSEARKVFDTTLAQYPAIKQFPNWPTALACMVIGQQTLAARQAAANPPVKAKRPIPVKIPTPRGAVPVVPTRQAPAETSENELADQVLSGNKEARLKYLQALVPK